MEKPVLYPPTGFGQVAPGIYRSAYPSLANVPFLRTLNLASIICLCPGKHKVLEPFCQECNITRHEHGTEGNNEPFQGISVEVMCTVLAKLLDSRNHPVLIHDVKGKHRTGCVVGCLRKLMGWDIMPILTEYKGFAEPKIRFADMRCIDLFDPTSVQFDLRYVLGVCAQAHFVQVSPCMVATFETGKGHQSNQR
eukprot:TRINITY_DN10993_c0_g1_i1.p1 TRINITY_DN10993_c0_g1~~TRINITY_DN10993_c0_g1_i1.p1  ORF type:complete len:194 (+),score=2.87 TRINITY_DN10993_c0_g1_i1:60-641(+)